MLCHGHVAFNVWINVLHSSSSSSTLLRLHDLKHKVTVIPHPLTLCHIPELYLQQHHCEMLKLHSPLLAECARTSQLTNTSITFTSVTMNWTQGLFRQSPDHRPPRSGTNCYSPLFLQQHCNKMFWQTLQLLIACCGNYQPKFKLSVFRPSAKVSSYCLGSCHFWSLHTHTHTVE
jgi:hypothetical protein